MSRAAEEAIASPDLDDGERRALRSKARSAVLEALRALGGDARRDLLLERARADGGFTPRELSALPPAAAAHKYASLLDHQLSWALTQLRRDGLVENPDRGQWRLAGAALEGQPLAIDVDVEPDRLQQLRTMPYREYLRTPEWQRTRAAAILRAGGSCSLDVTHTDGLEVHHRTYERLGEELASDLTVLCKACHLLHHQEHGRPRRASTPTARNRREADRDDRAAVVEGPVGTRRAPSLLRRLLG